MFVAGVIVGPVAGLLLSDFLFRSVTIGRLWAWLAIVLVLLALLLMPLLTVELRVGLAVGAFLGVLVGATPLEWSDRGLTG